MSLFRRRGLQFLTKQNNGEDESIETLLGGDKEKKDINGINGQEKGPLPTFRTDEPVHKESSTTRRIGLICLSCLLCLLCTALVLLWMLYVIPRDLFPVSNLMPFAENYSKCREIVSTGQHPDEMFTVIVNSYKRHDRMKNAVNHYRKCCGVKSVRVVWCEDPDPPPLTFFGDISAGDDCKSPACKSPAPIFFEKRRNSLNSRFEPIERIGTEGVFHVDDDIMVPCSELHTAFQVWLGNKDTLVGYFPRIHTRVHNGIEKGGYPSFTYGYWWKDSWILDLTMQTHVSLNLKVWGKASYSIILTKAAFLHIDFMDKYTNEMDGALRDYIDDHMSCEDILMALLVAKLSKVPPVYVRGDITDTGVTGGISTKQWLKSKHVIGRSECIGDLNALMGNSELPLVSTTWAVPQPMRRWEFLPSTWYEWFSGDQIRHLLHIFQVWNRNPSQQKIQ